jgi:hypothetical protein
VTYLKVSCPFADMPVHNAILGRAYSECQRFDENVVDALRRIQPDIVITTLSRWQHPVRDTDASPEAQGQALADLLLQVPGRKVVIADTPYAQVDVPACLSKHLSDIRPCAVPAATLTAGGSPERERTAARLAGGAVIDFTRVICGAGPTCPVVSHGMIVFRDAEHLTATYVRWLAPALDRALTKVIAS